MSPLVEINTASRIHHTPDRWRRREGHYAGYLLKRARGCGGLLEVMGEYMSTEDVYV